MLLAKEGAIVCVADVSEACISECRDNCDPELVDRVIFQQVDVADRNAVEQWIDGVAERFMRVDVLVHCAVDASWNPVEEQSVDSIVKTMRVGFEGLVYCTKCVLPKMRANGYGRIIYLSSVASTMHLFSGYASYAALKSATDAWAAVMRLDLRDSPIQVACVRPGVVKDTRLFRRSVDRVALPRMFDVLPSATPDQLAGVVHKAIQRCNRDYVYPRRYRIFHWIYQIAPAPSRWLCRFGTSQRIDIITRDDIGS